MDMNLGLQGNQVDNFRGIWDVVVQEDAWNKMDLKSDKWMGLWNDEIKEKFVESCKNTRRHSRTK